MFYYISFLRPPPSQASIAPTEPILITPQISNDLRTQYLDGPIDIYYVWSLVAPQPVSTKPAKLTSWRSSNAYKEIPVPRPPFLDSRPCLWRLTLTCGTKPDDQIVLLGEISTTGRTPLPVTSMPVTFCPRRGATASTRKQEQITRSYTFRVSGTQDSPVVFDITEQTSFDLDKKIWDSGVGLSSWLVSLFSSIGLADVRDALFSTDPRHVLELGAGSGIVAVTLAVLRSRLGLAEAGSIVTTDLASAMPVLRDNIFASHHLTNKCTPRAITLDWEEVEFAPQVQDQLEAGLDVIVMADVTYNTASFPALIRTLSRLIQGCKHVKESPPLVLMGYKERHPDERSLWGQAKDIGLHLRQVSRVDGTGGDPVEIWLGRFECANANWSTVIT